MLFCNVSDKTKRQNTRTLHESTEELVYTEQLNLKESGIVNVSKLLKKATSTTPTRSLKIQTACTISKNLNQLKCKEKTLTLIMDARSTKSHHTLLRLQTKRRNANIYPAHNRIIEAKTIPGKIKC